MQEPTRTQWIDAFTRAMCHFSAMGDPDSHFALAVLRYPAMKNLDPEEAAAADYFEWPVNRSGLVLADDASLGPATVSPAELPDAAR